jgi:hypothetical protein
MDRNGAYGTGFVLTTEELDRFIDRLREQGIPDEKLHRTKQRIDSFYNDLPERKLVTAMVLRNWREHMAGRGLSPRTVEAYVTAVNKLLKDTGHRELCFTQGHKKDLAGRVFGRLTAIEPMCKRSGSNRGIFWRCHCSCGNEIEVPANQLTKGACQSCGCLKLERLQAANGISIIQVSGWCCPIRCGPITTSGCPGVFRKNDKWAARIQYKGKIQYLGSYKKKEDAIRARKEAEARVRDDAERLLTELRGTKNAAAV